MSVNNEQIPMELKPEANMPDEHRSGFKKLFMKLGERVGTVSTTEFSKEYLDAVKEVDHYKEVVACVCSAVMGVIQENPEYVPLPFGKQQIESPKNEDPYEQLSNFSSSLKNYFSNKEALAATHDVSKKLGEEHRNFQQRVRRRLHFMRTFINVEYLSLEEERRMLLGYRQEMDYAYHECTSNLTEAKRQTYDRAQKCFNAQVDKVFEMVTQISQKKAGHANDILIVMRELQTYYEIASKEMEKLQSHRAQLGPPTKYDKLLQSKQA